jgi:hypothetical protein
MTPDACTGKYFKPQNELAAGLNVMAWFWEKSKESHTQQKIVN